MKRRLTDPDPERDSKYVKEKMQVRRLPFFLRIASAMENLLDKYTRPSCPDGAAELLDCIDLLVDMDHLGKDVAVIGCGPTPSTIRDLVARQYKVVGVEPVPDSAEQARKYIAGSAVIVQGTAEHIPLDNESQALVLLENVLEHVDSVTISLAEAFRVLKPGGVLFVRTTNRRRFSLTGINWEYTTRFYNWFPRSVKECYVFAQLHYRPELAHYSSRPAVHWFTYPDLCEHGRQVGFARFYSPYDLLYLARQERMPAWRFSFIHWYHRRPWLRALAVSQMNGDIFMWKRPSV